MVRNDKNFADILVEDNTVREFLKKSLYQLEFLRLILKELQKELKLNIYTAKPGIVIGKGGSGVEDLKKNVEKMIKDKTLL